MKRNIWLNGAAFVFTASLAIVTFAPGAAAQSSSAAAIKPANADATQARGEAIDPYFKTIYRNFYESYKLGPDDEIAIRVFGQPDYSLEKVTVSPFGRIYHPLIGDVDVAGLTLDQVNSVLTTDFGEYLKDPHVTVALIIAKSATVGVIGDVVKPGILVMAKPMTMLDAISASGGITDLGKSTNVTVLRQAGGGGMRTMTINVKHILQAKHDAGEENIALVPGDTVIVHGNFKKTLATITQLAGFGYFVHTVATQ